jgi:hypothetical protein
MHSMPYRTEKTDDFLDMPGGIGGLSLGWMFLEVCVGLRHSPMNRHRHSDRNR